jgi:hypothetical protein
MKANIVTWQNLARTVKMLDMINPLKIVIGDWWRTWVKVDARRASGSVYQNVGLTKRDLLVEQPDILEEGDEAGGEEGDWELSQELALAMSGL